MDSRTAVVVGAGPGTGAEIARLLAREGFALVLARRDADALAPLVADIEAAGGKALAVAADAAEEQDVAHLLDQAQTRFGAPELVIYNAGGITMGGVADTGLDQLEAMWRASARGGFLVGREAARRMIDWGRGTIVFTGATASVKGAADFSAFAAGKHGLRAIAQSMARELGPRGIHVAHLIIDGIIDVPRVHERMPEVTAAKGADGLIDPRSVAATMLWLHRQPRDAWTFELDLRPFKEPW